MEFVEKKFKGCYEITLNPNMDERGFFMRTYDHLIFLGKDLDRGWVQESHSRSDCRGTIRGMHFQFPPYSETKLIRCIRGEVLDVFIDLRLNSETFGQWDSAVLSEKKRNMVFLCRGIAHGFCTLTDDCEMLYKIDNYYNAGSMGGINCMDPDLAIPWPVENPLLSERDKQLMPLKDFIEIHKGLKS